MPREYRIRVGSLLGLSMLGLSICLTAAVGEERGANPNTSAECPTRFDYEVLASAADSGNLLTLSMYRFRSDTSYSSIPITGLQRVAFRSDLVMSDCRFHRQRTLQQRD
jgi:hypothetical protein